MQCWKEKGWFTAHQQQVAETEAGVKVAASLPAAFSPFVQSCTAHRFSDCSSCIPSATQLAILQPTANFGANLLSKMLFECYYKKACLQKNAHMS